MKNNRVIEFGEKSPHWMGDEVGYSGVHLWLQREFGKASKCELCGTTSKKRFEWANISGQYKRDRNDFMELCASCHRRYDYGNLCKRGHEFTPENTYIRKEGWRVCKQCVKIAQEVYKKKKV